jgi:hypothetical protein
MGLGIILAFWAIVGTVAAAFGAATLGFDGTAHTQR